MSDQETDHSDSSQVVEPSSRKIEKQEKVKLKSKYVIPGI